MSKLFMLSVCCHEKIILTRTNEDMLEKCSSAVTKTDIDNQKIYLFFYLGVLHYVQIRVQREEFLRLNIYNAKDTVRSV